MEIINTELTTAEIADRLASKREQTWTYTSTHGKTCDTCAEATGTARIYAQATGSVSSTYKLSHYSNGDHAGTATRVQ